MNLPMPEGRARRRLIGPPVETTLRRYTNDDPLPYGNRFRQIYSTVDLAATNKLYDGIKELLGSLSRADYRLFIATSKAENFAVSILNYLGVAKYFCGIYGSRYDLGRFTKSLVLQAVIDDFGLDKSECILVGDTVYDAEGAEEVGIAMGVASYGFGEKEDFMNKKTVFFADTPAKIRSCLEEL